MAAPPAGDGGGGAPAGSAAAACAACKYQRRRCTADCPLAPYFPSDRPRVFRNARRLFGVSNILKTLARVGDDDPVRRHEAMQCIVYESQAWDVYPDSGCVPIIADLQRRIRQAEDELRRVNAEIQAHRRGNSAAAAAAAAAVTDGGGGIYGGGGERRQQQIIPMAMPMITSDEQSLQTLPPWMMIQHPPPQCEHHPLFLADDATTTAMMMRVPQFQHHHHQPIVISTQLPELQDDTVNYFADEDGENNKILGESI